MSVTKAQWLSEADEAELQAVARAITSVKQQSGYGSIEITVHDGRVTQIERREKVRLDQQQLNTTLTVKTAAK